MKIFFGMMNISSLYEEYVKGFTALGHEVFSVDFMEGGGIIADQHTSFQVPNFIKQKMREEQSSDPARHQYWLEHCVQFAWRKALEADLCFFMWQTFAADNQDLAYLKQMGKKIVVRFIGTESRVAELDEQFNALNQRSHTDYSLKRGIDEMKRKIRYVRMVEKYADLTLCGSALTLRPSYVDFFMIDPANIPFNPMPNDVPVLLHAPSNTATKGTREWRQIFSQLENEGLNFRLKLVEGMDHNEFLKEYAKADVYCGGLYQGGKAELEALAGGAIPLAASFKWPPSNHSVAGYIREVAANTARALAIDIKDAQFKIINQIKRESCQANNIYYSLVQHITPDSAADVLRKFILNPQKRFEQAHAGRKFIDTYCPPQKRCQDILDILDRPESVESHAQLQQYTFFYNEYKPRQDAIWLHTLNSATAMVKNCTWYKQYIKPLHRDGLIF